MSRRVSYIFEVVSSLPDAGMKEMQKHCSCAFAGISTSLRQDRSTFANAGSPKSLEIMQLEMVYKRIHKGFRSTRIVQRQLMSPGGVCAYGCKLVSIASQGGLTASTIYHSFVVTCLV